MSPSPAKPPVETLAVSAAPTGVRPAAERPRSAQSLISTKAPSAPWLVLPASMQNPGGAAMVTGSPATTTRAREALAPPAPTAAMVAGSQAASAARPSSPSAAASGRSEVGIDVPLLAGAGVGDGAEPGGAD